MAIKNAFIIDFKKYHLYDTPKTSNHSIENQGLYSNEYSNYNIGLFTYKILYNY